MSDSALVDKITRMVAPLVRDLGLDLYDLEYRGGILRIVVDTPPGSPGGVDLDTIALLTRMVSRDFDHDDPMPGHYTLEVSSPGLERTLRVPAHYVREIGKTVAIRLRDVAAGDRRLQGVLIAATDDDCTVRLDDTLEERVVPFTQIDRCKTVFVWGPTPKPGSPTKGGTGPKAKPKPKVKPSSTNAEAPSASATAGSIPSTSHDTTQEAS
jgi:ribosome maturation factor RimP